MKRLFTSITSFKLSTQFGFALTANEESNNSPIIDFFILSPKFLFFANLT
jgi:hypothetical protein